MQCFAIKVNQNIVRLDVSVHHMTLLNAIKCFSHHPDKVFQQLLRCSQLLVEAFMNDRVDSLTMEEFSFDIEQVL